MHIEDPRTVMAGSLLWRVDTEIVMTHLCHGPPDEACVGVLVTVEDSRSPLQYCSSWLIPPDPVLWKKLLEECDSPFFMLCIHLVHPRPNVRKRVRVQRPNQWVHDDVVDQRDIHADVEGTHRTNGWCQRVKGCFVCLLEDTETRYEGVVEFWLNARVAGPFDQGLQCGANILPVWKGVSYLREKGRSDGTVARDVLAFVILLPQKMTGRVVLRAASMSISRKPSARKRCLTLHVGLPVNCITRYAGSIDSRSKPLLSRLILPHHLPPLPHLACLLRQSLIRRPHLQHTH